MSSEPHLELAHDMRHARAIDLSRFLNHDDDLPASIAAAAQDPGDWLGLVARQLCAIAGSADAIELLDTIPHLDDGFNWSAIPTEDHDRVTALLALVDSPHPVGFGNDDTSWEALDMADAGMPWVDDEYRTIIHRVLRTLAIDPQRPLKRRCKPERLAAAIVWVALAASNGIVSRGRGRWKSRDVWEWFDVTSCKDIGQQLAHALRKFNDADARQFVGPVSWSQSDAPVVASARLLHSNYRATLIEERERLHTRLAERRQSARANHPIQCHDGRQVELRSRPVRVRWASKGASKDGRAAISLALGEDLTDLEILAFSITDARRLIMAIELALNEPANDSPPAV